MERRTESVFPGGLARPSLAIVGAGKVGSTLARTWALQGVRIAAIASRTHSHAEALAHELGALATNALNAAASAELTVLAVPDDAIQSVAASLWILDWTGKAVVHTSGARSLDVLRALHERGAMTGSLHPAYPFAHDRLPDGVLRDICLALESDHALLSQWLYDLIDAAEGRALTLRPESKPLYHAALALTSNYAVTLYAASRRLLTNLGADGPTADAALLALLGGTLDNLRERGVPEALTGPLVRGDVGTVEAHLRALEQQPDIRAAYVALARLTLPLLAERSMDTGFLERLLNTSEGL